MMDEKRTGRVTIPTDLDAVPETLTLMQRWGADAIRDCDGTEFPEALRNTGAKVYATYYTTRKDNAWAKANPDEIQQCYIMTPFFTADGEGALQIPLMKGISRELLQVNDRDDIARWWEVMDRTTGQPLPAGAWSYDADKEAVVISAPAAYHEYTVSFLAYLIWDPVHMYNSVINGWTDVEHQIPFDVRQPKTHQYTLERLRRFLESHPYVDVVRFTTFFHLFTLVFDELRREKYVDWYGYSASVSPYILEQFEKEVGYKFRPEYIIDQGYYNNQYRVPSKEFKDFQAFQQREVNRLVREMTDIVHEYGKEAMMFLGDHWIGTEPFGPVFAQSGVDAIVGSVGNGSTLRLISDIPGVKYTEGRFLPYFFPDTFHEGGDPIREAKENWVTARRAILRKPIDRVHQLTELCTRYGELFCVWMDGACGEGPNGKRQVYDWPRYYETVRRLQPGAVLSVCGPDVRWCGNEAGHCRPSEWSVVPAQLMDAAYTAGRSQQADDGTFSRRVNRQDEDLGSRDVIAAAGELAWYPAEVDTSVRPGWFYHPEEDSQVRTPEELLDIYLDAVGGNAALLLNVPPAPNGRIAPPDCAALAGLGRKIQNLFALDRTGLGELSAPGSAEGNPLACAADGRSDTWWQSAPGEGQPTLTLTFAQPQEISCVVLGEYLPAGQHIEAGEIRADGRTVAGFTVVGHKRICRFAPVRAKQVTVCITASRAEPALRLLVVYREQQAE